jgi:hypothetical protein
MTYIMFFLSDYSRQQEETWESEEGTQSNILASGTQVRLLSYA